MFKIPLLGLSQPKTKHKLCANCSFMFLPMLGIKFE